MNQNLIKYLGLFYDQVQLPIQVTDKSGKIVYVNHSFSLMWGYTLEELKEFNLFDDPEFKNIDVMGIVSKVLQQKKSIVTMNYNDSLLKAKQVAKPFLKTRIFTIEFEGEEFIVFYHEDETEMILLQNEFIKISGVNKESERLKNNFLNVLSHELRTPLNIILGYSGILKESIKDKINSEEKIYLDNLHAGGERLFKSITQMLEFAQMETENYKIEMKKVDLNKTLKNCLDTVKDSTLEKNIKLNTNFSSKEIFVEVDEQFIENAVSNLLNNAIKFTTRGFIEIETDIVEDRDIAICKIKDSGVGISAKYMDHLFQPFSQEDLNIGRNFEGNGLGLALSKKYIERLGGSLLVDSIKGVGTTVTFTLPLSAGNQNTHEDKNGAKKILMLDDTNDSSELVSAYLKKTFSLEICDPYILNYDVFDKRDYRAILFDVYQNKWDESLFICREIKHKDQYSRPIIIISSEFEGNKIREFYEAGADKFIVKPFSKNDLLKSFEELKV